MKLKRIMAVAMALTIVCGASYTANSLFSKDSNIVQAIEVGEDRNGNTITYDDGVFTVSGTGEAQVIGLANVTGNRKLVIEEGITSIGEGSFSGWPDLEEVQLPSTLTEIKEDAFGGCYNLKSIVIPDSVTILGQGAFSGCKSLETVKLPNSITEIPQSEFCGCESLKAIELPDTLKTIGVMAFYKCNSLTTVVIPASVTDLMQPFGLCANLESVYILNPDCEIANKRSFSNEMDENGNSVVFNGTFYGYSGSTTEKYAKDFNRKFVAIDGIDIPTTATTTTVTTTTTTTTTATTTTTTTTEATTTKTTETKTTESTTTSSETSTASETTTEPVTTTVTTPTNEVPFGDPTGDGKIDAKDASFTLVEYAKLSTGGESSLTENERKAADVNKDGKVDSKDASTILQYYAYTSTGGTDTIEVYLGYEGASVITTTSDISTETTTTEATTTTTTTTTTATATTTATTTEATTTTTGMSSSENKASTAETSTEAQAPGEITYAPSEEILNATFSSGLVQIGNDIFKQGGYMTVSQFIEQYGDKYDCSEIEPDLGIETNNRYFFYYKVWSVADPRLGIELYTTPTPDNNGNGTINDAVITRFAPTTRDGSDAPCWRPHEAEEDTLTIDKYVGICQSEDLSETTPYSNNGAGLTIDGLNEHINTYSVEYDKDTGTDPFAEKYDSVLATVELTDVNLYGVKPIMIYCLAVYHKASGDEPDYSLGPYYTGHEVFHN